MCKSQNAIGSFQGEADTLGQQYPYSHQPKKNVNYVWFEAEIETVSITLWYGWNALSELTLITRVFLSKLGENLNIKLQVTVCNLKLEFHLFEFCSVTI